MNNNARDDVDNGAGWLHVVIAELLPLDEEEREIRINNLAEEMYLKQYKFNKVHTDAWIRSSARERAYEQRSEFWKHLWKHLEAAVEARQRMQAQVAQHKTLVV